METSFLISAVGFPETGSLDACSQSLHGAAALSALRRPQQRCHLEVPLHPRGSALKPHWHPVLTPAPQLDKQQLPQTLVPLSAGKILGGIIRDLAGFEELVVIFTASAGLSLSVRKVMTHSSSLPEERRKGNDQELQRQI